jgi:hypothetical protein
MEWIRMQMSPLTTSSHILRRRTEFMQQQGHYKIKLALRLVCCQLDSCYGKHTTLPTSVKIKTTKAKANQMTNKFNMLRDMETKAQIAAEKRDGTYKSGGNLTGEFDQEDEANPPKKKAKKGPVFCPLCKKKGHKTKNSKHCLFNPNNPKFKVNRVPVKEQDDPETNTAAAPMPFDPIEEIDANDADNMDTLPFDYESSSNKSYGNLDDFHDAGTWSEDED